MSLVQIKTISTIPAPGMAPQTLNMMVYEPTNYDPTVACPCMIYLPGAGEIGTNPALLQVHGPFLYLTTENPPDLGLNMLILAIQNVNPNPQPLEIQGYLNAIKALYKISAFIGTGISRGGEDWDWFIGNAQSQCNELAALCLASSQYTGGVINEPGALGNWEPGWMAAAKLPYWQACGTADGFYSLYTPEGGKEVLTGGILWKYQQYKAMEPNLAFFDTWAGVGHSDPVWSDFFNPAWTSPSVGSNIYKWAAQFGAAVVVPTPPVVVAPTAGLQLVPASAAQLALVTPKEGLVYYNSDSEKITVGNGTAWE